MTRAGANGSPALGLGWGKYARLCAEDIAVTARTRTVRLRAKHRQVRMIALIAGFVTRNQYLLRLLHLWRPAIRERRGTKGARTAGGARRPAHSRSTSSTRFSLVRLALFQRSGRDDQVQ